MEGTKTSQTIKGVSLYQNTPEDIMVHCIVRCQGLFFLTNNTNKKRTAVYFLSGIRIIDESTISLL